MSESCHEAAWLCWVEAHPALAGWFQAIGSIAAIVVALMVPYVQHQVQQRRERRRVAHAIVHLAHQAGSILGQLVKIAASPTQLEGMHRLQAFPEEMLDTVIDDLDRLPVQQFDDYDALGAVIALRGQMQRARGTLTAALAAQDVDGWEAIFGTQKEQAEEQISILVSRFGPHSKFAKPSLRSLQKRVRSGWKSVPLPWLRANGKTTENT